MIFVEDAFDFLKKSEYAKIKKIANFVLDALGFADQDITIALKDDKTLRELNQQFLGKDSPTDVLSFNADEINPETGKPYLGDLVLSIEKIREQAREHNIPAFQELSTLVVHGILHLCGYDHADERSEREMFKLQNDFVESFGEKDQ